MNHWAIFLLTILLLALLAFLATTAYRHLHARRLGLPAPPLNPFASRPSAYTPPSPARSGLLGRLTSALSGLRNPRTFSAGAYEPSARRARGSDPLDPDGAWDTRVGTEADYGVGPSGAGREGYYESQELGVRDAGVGGAYAGSGYGGGRGRSRDRDELDERYDEEMGRAGGDPFDDEAAERSDLRGVSPRPVDGHDRRSAFREDM